MLATGAGKEKEKSEKKIFFTIVSNSAEGEKKKKSWHGFWPNWEIMQ